MIKYLHYTVIEMHNQRSSRMHSRSIQIQCTSAREQVCSGSTDSGFEGV